MNYSPPGSSVHGVFQARILEWVATPSPGDFPDLGVKPRSPALESDSSPPELQGSHRDQGTYLTPIAAWSPAKSVSSLNRATLVTHRLEREKSMCCLKLLSWEFVTKPCCSIGGAIQHACLPSVLFLFLGGFLKDSTCQLPFTPRLSPQSVCCWEAKGAHGWTIFNRRSDRKTFHTSMYGEVVLAYVWFNLNFILTRMACFVAIIYIYYTSAINY